MPEGAVTLDQIDINDLWYGPAGIRAAVDTYRQMTLPIIPALALSWGETLMKYGLSERNGFQVLGPGELPEIEVRRDRDLPADGQEIRVRCGDGRGHAASDHWAGDHARDEPAAHGGSGERDVPVPGAAADEPRDEQRADSACGMDSTLRKRRSPRRRAMVRTPSRRRTRTTRPRRSPMSFRWTTSWR